ncbi:uncharacterized protein LOC105704442 [Orussus abietinus]|uniref:uncharacterized protein LOC105704442 n=1 Tax=Orussus abietinus TaxID=222816 RepID=UPI000C71629D|nr:uncharacterized protein LOC105704442 [Orussus abietinus]
MQTRPTLVDSFVKYDTRLAKLKEELLRAKREHDGREQGLEESEEVKMQEAACPKCRGDGAETRDIPHITDLCPADKKRIAELVGKLAKCTQERNKAESELAICREKNKALENRYRIFLNRHEDETRITLFQLSDATTKTNKLQLQTSHSLDLLSRQIQIQETQFKELSDSVWVLLREKMQLQNLAIEKEARAKVAEAKIERMKEKLEMEKLVFLKEQAKNLIVATYDKSCQTREDLANASRMQIKQIKSEDDLDAPSSEAALVRELFFKHPDVDDVLNMTSVFPLIHTLD